MLSANFFSLFSVFDVEYRFPVPILYQYQLDDELNGICEEKQEFLVNDL